MRTPRYAHTVRAALCKPAVAVPLILATACGLDYGERGRESFDPTRAKPAVSFRNQAGAAGAASARSTYGGSGASGSSRPRNSNAGSNTGQSDGTGSVPASGTSSAPPSGGNGGGSATSDNSPPDPCGAAGRLCELGEGNCEKDEDCASDLVCVVGKGAQYSPHAPSDTCAPAHCDNGEFEPGLGEIATDCGGACGAICSCGETIEVTLGNVCHSGRGGACAPGIVQCREGLLVCVGAITPGVERCDGLDNDCDGVVDNDNPEGGYDCHANALGVCANGTTRCVEGRLECLQLESPSVEICDGLDNDCNGLTDAKDEQIDADGDGAPKCLDCDDLDARSWLSCLSCVDGDLDGHYADCDAYPRGQERDDCDSDPDNWKSCQSCQDSDGDGQYTNCDHYTTRPGPDCNDANALISSCAKHVILFIGDGMGKVQVQAGRYFVNGNSARLSFEDFPHTGEVSTYSADSEITDSAAGATAIATGHKVNNGVVSVATPGDGSDLETVLELRKRRGQATGIITIHDSISSATPAAFAAHAAGRYLYDEIMDDLLTGSSPDILFGDGNPSVPLGKFMAAGYSYVETESTLVGLSGDSLQRLFGAFPARSPDLATRTRVALDLLEEDTEGFFLIVEQANTDKAGHGADLATAVAAVAELDQAVQVAVNWAKGRSDTLIVVTADHETGALSCPVDVVATPIAGVVPFAQCSYPGTSGHTAANVPIYALGMGAEFVSGTLDNTQTYFILAGHGL